MANIGHLLKNTWTRFKHLWRYRSSVTGLFVTRDFAEQHPETTQREDADPK